MVIFITGILGQLGYDVMEVATFCGHIVYGCGRKECDLKNYTKTDLCDYNKIRSTLLEIKPDVIIHCAAWTQVDLAELNENKNSVFNDNVLATNNITLIAEELNTKLIYISTDYVFNCNKLKSPIGTPGIPSPVNYYGLTKYLGEQCVRTYKKSFIVRTSWVYGKHGNNFVETMLKNKNSQNLTIVNDQFGRPTNTKDLSILLMEMCESEKYDIYHATNEGDIISWYDFAKEILKEYGTNITPISTEEYIKNSNKIIAQRPSYSVLSTNELTVGGFKRLPDWKKSLKEYLETKI